MMKPLSTCLFALLFTILLFTSVQARQPVGYVEHLGAQSKAFRLVRNGEELDVAVMTPLHTGDQIEIVPERCKQDDPCTITFELCNQQHVQVTVDHSPYTIAEDFECEYPSALEKFLTWAATPFKRSHKQSRQLHHLGTTMGGSDAPLSLPLLSEGKARVTAGERTFSLAWRGGEAPYQIRLYREGSDTPIFEQKDIQENRLKQEGMLFTEGSYRVEVQDAEHEPIIATFQVVPATELPQLPAEFGEPLQQSTLENNAKNTLFALWLTEEHEGWEFEAYQLVAPLAEDYYPALLVREQLELE